MSIEAALVDTDTLTKLPEADVESLLSTVDASMENDEVLELVGERVDEFDN